MAEEDKPLVFRIPGAEETAATSTAPAPQSGTPQETETQEPPVFPQNGYVPPFYPFSWRMEGVEGQVSLYLTIGTGGDVEQVNVVASTAPQFNDYVVEAAKQWKFIPGRVNGNAVRSGIPFTFPFVSEFGSGGVRRDSPLAGLTFVNGTYYTTNQAGEYVPADVGEPIPLLQPEPRFPAELVGDKDLRAVVTFNVDPEGRVVNPRVVESSSSSFDQAVLDAVRFWQFIPRIRGGRAVQSAVQVPFVLNADAAK